MNVLVTGGFGCIGTYVARDLLNAGESVVIYDMVEDHSIPKMVLSDDQIAALTFQPGDITDLPGILRAIKHHKIDKIVHLASWQVPACQANPPMALKIVSEGTINIFEAQRIFELPRVVWASSVAVFGSPEDYEGKQVQNDDPHFPKFIYGANKSLCERYALHYFDQYGCDTIGLRFTAVYGVGRTRGMSSFTTKMIEAAAYGESYTVPFGDDIVDWQYVEDVSASIVKSLGVPTTKTRSFTVKGDFRSVKAGVEYVKKLVPDADLTVQDGVFGIQWDYDATPLTEQVRFTPEYSMERGIERTLERFREIKQLLRP
ncbi:MAG: NAD(P)-dependent oxidoreductase [Candidatus Poribacteria bacterium]|nr:NAD(P)-dependent oxidoreductase [Candidatus Poribacteria bacterium]